jgi:methyltransferase-like protein
MDFLRNRMFRQTLLCQQHVTPRYALRPEQLMTLYVASPARPVSAAPNLHSADTEQFQGPDGITLSSREPLVKAAMLYLAEVWPQAVPYPALLTAAQTRLQSASRHDAAATAREGQHLAQCLLSFYTSASTSLVELHVEPPRFVTAVSDRPAASPLARLQAAAGPHVTNLRHELVGLGDFDRQVVCHLDGSRDRAALLEVLADLVNQGVLRVQQDGQPVTEATAIRGHLGRALDEALPRLARNALFVS